MSRPSVVPVLLALVIGLAGPVAYGQNRHPAKPVKHAETGLKVSTLAGKFAFTLPQGYTAEAMAPGDATNGTAGSTGTMYASEKSKRVVITTQVPTPEGVTAGDNDPAFLAKATADFIAEQSKATADFKQLAQSNLVIRKLGVSRVDSTATMGGGPTLDTTFIAGSGHTVSLVQIISRADDKAGHEKLVKRVQAGR